MHAGLIRQRITDYETTKINVKNSWPSWAFFKLKRHAIFKIFVATRYLWSGTTLGFKRSEADTMSYMLEFLSKKVNKFMGFIAKFMGSKQCALLNCKTSLYLGVVHVLQMTEPERYRTGWHGDKLFYYYY